MIKPAGCIWGENVGCGFDDLTRTGNDASCFPTQIFLELLIDLKDGTSISSG